MSPGWPPTSGRYLPTARATHGPGCGTGEDRGGRYLVQGWRRERIYLDFIFVVQPGDRFGKGNRLVVLEIKGERLKGSPNTGYKQAVLRLMTVAFRIAQTQRVGELGLVSADGTKVACDLVLMAEWKAKLPKEFIR